MFKFDFDVEAEEPQASGSTIPAPLQRGDVKPSHDISLKDLVSIGALAARSTGPQRSRVVGPNPLGDCSYVSYELDGV